MEPLNVALQANKLAPYIITLNPVLMAQSVSNLLYKALIKRPLVLIKRPSALTAACRSDRAAICFASS